MKVQLQSRIQLKTYTNGLKSGSLKRIAEGLTKALGYKVWRTTKARADRKQFQYGDQVNKLAQYTWFQQQGLSALVFTTDINQAKKWIKDGFTVVCRQTLTGSEGKGIVLAETVEQLVQCPVYTQYKPKKREFRVHIFKNTVVNIVEKKLKKDWNGPKNTKVRNTANGYTFVQGFELSPQLRAKLEQVSLAASKVCGSDFRGVDVGYNEKNDDAFIIEVNSAPGIEGSNVDKYVAVIKKYA